MSLSLASGSAPTLGTGLSAGNNFTGTGVLTITDTNASGTLTVTDTAGGTPGHLVAATSTSTPGTTCYQSEADLANALSVYITGPALGAMPTGTSTTTTSGSPQTISGATPTVVSTTQPVAAAILASNYKLSINSSEILKALCPYTMTVTYTLT